MRSKPIGVSDELVGAEAVDAGAGADEEVEVAFNSELSRGSSILLLAALGIAYYFGASYWKSWDACNIPGYDKSWPSRRHTDVQNTGNCAY